MQELELSPEQYAEAVAALADEELQEEGLQAQLLNSGAYDEELEEAAMAPVADMRQLIDRDAYSTVSSSSCPPGLTGTSNSRKAGAAAALHNAQSLEQVCAPAAGAAM